MREGGEGKGVCCGGYWMVFLNGGGCELMGRNNGDSLVEPEAGDCVGAELKGF